MANEHGHHHWADTYSPNPNDAKKASSGSGDNAKANTALNVNEEDINKAYNTDVKDRQTNTFKQ